jgi:hypothetical protein
MNDSKIDQRIKEIEDEVVLLTDYMSEALEKKLGVHIKDLKESIDKLQKSGQNIGTGELKLPELSENLSELKSGIDNIIKIVGSKEYKTNDSGIDQSIENNLGGILEKLGSLDADINESIKITAENKEELLKTFLENINNLKTLSETIQHLCAVDKDSTLGEEIRLINKHTEEISGEIVNLSETGLKGLTSVEEALKNTEGKNAVKQEELKNTLHENFDMLGLSIDKISQLFKMDEGKQFGTEIALISEKLENVTKELPNFAKTVQNGISQLNTGVQNSVQQTTKQQLEIKDALLKEIKNINDNAEVIRRMCSTDQEKFLGSMTTVVYNNMNELSEAMVSLQEKVKNWLVTIDKNLRTIANQSESKQEEMKKIILYDVNRINDIVETLKTWCTTEDTRPLGGEIITVSNRVGKIFEESPLILDKVTTLSNQLDKVSYEVMRMRWFVMGAVAVSIIVLIVSFFK